MHILIGNSLGHLGNAYYEQKRYEQAGEKFKEALVILEKHHSPDNPELQAVIRSSYILWNKQINIKSWSKFI